MENLNNSKSKEKIEPLGHFCTSLGHLPSSYSISLSYEEQILLIGKKTEEIIAFINDILEQQLNEYITKMFNNIIINSMYEPETETLILYIDRKEDK